MSHSSGASSTALAATANSQVSQSANGLTSKAPSPSKPVRAYRLKMQGFIVMDYADKDAEAETAIGQWYQDGKMKVVEDVLEGLDAAPGGLIGLLAGENRGKRMVRVGPDP